MVGNPGTTSTENIDEVILRLLKIKSGTEIDYQTYFDILKKKLTIHAVFEGNKLPQEEQDLLIDELNRIRKIKDRGARFKVKEKKVKVSSAAPPSPGGPDGGPKDPGNPPKTSSIIKAPPGGKITPDKVRPPQVEPVNVKDITEKTAAISKGSSPLVSINEKLDSIINTLTNLDKENRKEKERQRKNEEQKRRSEKEKGLESKTFDGLKKVISAVTKPFQSIWERILNFIFYTLLGRVMMKLLDWFADPKNKDKIQSLIRFVKDWWPALLGSYILFGTSFGKLTRSLVGMVGRFIFQIGKVAIPNLLRVIAANPITSLLVGGALAAGVGAYVSTQQNEKRREEFKKKDPSIVTPRETREQGKTPGTSQLLQEQTLQRGFAMFNGGGYANYGNLFGGLGGAAMGAGMGSMFGPMGMLLGAGLGGAAGSGMFNGFVSGQKGVDKVPAMLSDGEFVMSAGAVRKYGVETLESMNAAGGGDNKPKVVGGTTYAAGGGYVGQTPREERLRRAYNSRFGEDFTSKLTNDQLRQISNHYNSLPTNKASAIDSRRIMGYGDELKDMAEQMIKGNMPQSFTQSSRVASGLTELEGKLRSSERISRVLRYDTPQLSGSNPTPTPTSTSTPKPTIRTLPASRMLPAAGESSANAMRAAERAASRIRAPIPASSAIVPYTGGGLARTGVTAGLSAPQIPQIRTNMNVPGGRIRGGSLSAVLAAFEMKQRMDEGQTATQAGLGAGGAALGGQLGWMAGAKAGALAGAALGSIVPGLGTGVGAAVGAIVGGLAAGYGGAMLGGKLADDLSGVNAAKERASRGGIGGSIKGGYGLKNQSFKDAPKTMVMTDDKGRPFVGHKAMRNGQLTYVRPPTPGTGTTNPFEALGRMINPGAYRENDQRLAMQNQKIAMVNALESFQRQGMAPDAQARMMKQMGGNLKDVQNDLNYRRKTERENYNNRLTEDTAKRSRMNSLASQKRLDDLTWNNVGPDMMPKRFATEQAAGKKEYDERGGMWGGLSRGWMSAFGSDKDRQNIAAQDKASQARIKQRGAESIGRYYSSSDGKYYKDYNAAVKARQARLAAQQTRRPAARPLPRPQPRPQVAGGGMGGRRGSGSNPSAQRAPSPSPRHRAGTRTTERTTGTRR